MAASSLIEFRPNPGVAVRQLFVLLHGVGRNPDQLEGLGLALRMAFPGAVVLIPEGFEPSGGAAGRQWFSVQGVSEDNRADRVVQALPPLLEYVRAAQRRFRLHAAHTALAGFSQGAIMSLEAAQADPHLAGRVLAFGGRYASLPKLAPPYTTIHLLHGADDAVMPVAHAKDALERLAALRGDVTLDIASRVAHEPHPALIECAIHRLKTCVPLRSWAQAMSMDPMLPEGETVH
jgi:phospholipase/carboxylesterase